MDQAFKCRYEVLIEVFNHLGADTLEFEAYDHYGRPAFENDSVVLLCVSFASRGLFVHQKYQFDKLKHKSYGQWIGENGQSLQVLFRRKKESVFKAQGLF